MEQNRTIKIVAHLNSDVIISPDGYLTLDSIVHHILERQLGDAGAALSAMPFKTVGSVFAASSAFFHEAYMSSTSRVGSLRGERDLHSSLFNPHRGGKKKPYWDKVDLSRHDDGTKALMSTYQSIHAKYAYWFVALKDEQDARFLLSLLDAGMIGLGRRWNAGHGQIERFEVMDAGENTALVLDDGSPARPIPIEEWGRSIDGVRTEIVSCLPPYFETPIRSCVINESRIRLDD